MHSCRNCFVVVAFAVGAILQWDVQRVSI